MTSPLSEAEKMKWGRGDSGYPKFTQPPTAEQNSQRFATNSPTLLGVALEGVEAALKVGLVLAASLENIGSKAVEASHTWHDLGGV